MAAMPMPLIPGMMPHFPGMPGMPPMGMPGMPMFPGKHLGWSLAAGS